MSIASHTPASFALTDVVGDATTTNLVQVHADQDEVPPHIGEALPEHHCAKNPHLELCQTDAVTAQTTDLSPFIEAGALMLLAYLAFFIGKLFFQTKDDRIRTNIKIAVAVSTAGLLLTYLAA